MLSDNQYSLSTYKEISPLCEKGHVVLVQNNCDGNFYVRKQIPCYNPDVYTLLQKKPVKNIPTIIAVYEDLSPDLNEKNLIIIEEYIQGSTLAELLEEKGIFSEKETIDIAMQLCRILMDLHKLKPSVIHRDIKPSNIMLSSDGTVKLLDFNAAKAEDSSKNRDTVLLGTAGFAAPEQYGFSSSSPRTDIYAVGVLINIMLNGKLPSEQIASGKLKKVINRCLRFNPKDRYRDVEELYYVLKRMNKEKVNWLIPGFRTLQIYKMIPAFLGYAFLLIFILRIDSSGFDTIIEFYSFRTTCLLTSFMTIFFYADYLNMQKIFPFMRSPHKMLRLLGLLLGPVIIFWIIVIIIVICEMYILPLLLG